MYTVVGFRNVNYTSKKGNQVTGIELHCVEESNRITGYGVERIYIGDNILSESGVNAADFTVDTTFECTYNKYGRIANVRIYEPKEA